MNHVLVIRLSALGDVAIMSPVVIACAEANPGVHFTVAAPPLLEPLFKGPSNLTFLGVNKKQSATAIYRQLLAVGADAVADLHQINKVGWALLMLWFHEILHFHFRFSIHRLHKGRWTRFLMIHHLSRHPRRPQYERYADVFRRMGLKGMDAIKADTLTVKATPPGSKPSIGIAPFAQHEGKIWPFEYTGRLASLLCEQGYHLVLFGSRDEAPKLEQLASTLPDAVSLAGKESFCQELETMRRLTLMVTMDSSNMHFASVVGTPVVSIWGATHPDFGFYGYRQSRDNALCAELPCQPCSAYGQRPCRYGDYRCLHAVTPEQVLNRITQLIN